MGNLIENPEGYFGNEKKSLEARINNILLDNDVEKEIAITKTLKTIKDQTLGIFKVGEIIKTVLDWNKNIDEEIKNAKKNLLLESYFNKTDDLNFAIDSLKNLLTNPQGNTLFNKIIRILDNTPPDLELTINLSKALKYVTQTNFINLYDDHKFALHQIELLSPQALALLADYENWPDFKKLTPHTGGPKGTITSDWHNDFSEGYVTYKENVKSEFKDKIAHSINELVKNKYVEGKKIDDGENKGLIKPSLTPIGYLLLRYIQ